MMSFEAFNSLVQEIYDSERVESGV